MNRRRTQGSETRHRLVEWDRGQAASERLAGQLLAVEGFRAIDPSHPLGGPDGLKDIVCTREGLSWTASVYFPRGQKPFSAIRRKFIADTAGPDTATGFIFITNQNLRIHERQQLQSTIGDRKLELLHLDRIAQLLNQPTAYGSRLEFLDIDMTKDEQLAFFAARDEVLRTVTTVLERLESRVGSGEPTQTLTIPLEEIREFRQILNSVAGRGGWLTGASLWSEARVQDLYIPLEDLRQFARLLQEICGTASVLTFSGTHAHATIRDLRVPLDELKQFAELLERVCGRGPFGGGMSLRAQASLHEVRVPLDELREYGILLDGLLAKVRKLREIGWQGPLEGDRFL